MHFPGLGLPELLIVGFLLLVLPALWAWALVHCFQRRDDPDRLAWLVVLGVVPWLAVPVYGWLKMVPRSSKSTSALLLALLFGAAVESEAQPVALTSRVPAAGAVAAPTPEGAGVLDRLEVEEAIRSIYGRLADLVVRSGGEVSFAVSDVVTYLPSQFGDVRWSRVATPPGGPQLRAHAHGRAYDLPSQEEASYQLEWETPWEPPAEQVAQLEQLYESLTVLEVLELSMLEQPDRYRGVGAFSSFAVTVGFGGKSRSYRANIFWKALGADQVLFSLTDGVVLDASAAFHEDRPIVAWDQINPSAPRPTLEPAAASLDPARESHREACEAARAAAYFERMPCQERSSSLVAVDLHGRGEPIPLGTGAVTLRRLEPSSATHHGQAIRYLVGEWAHIAVPAGGASGLEVKSATVEDFGAGALSAVSETLTARLTAPASGAREALVVAVPLAEPASRRIPLPALRLDAPTGPRPEAPRGRALLLADFSEDHTLRKLSVLHATAGVPRELALDLERRLKLEPPTPEPHRVVAFVLVDVGAQVEIVSELLYLPRSCCGDAFCQ